MVSDGLLPFVLFSVLESLSYPGSLSVTNQSIIARTLQAESPAVRAEPFDSPFALSTSKDERLAQEGLVEA